MSAPIGSLFQLFRFFWLVSHRNLPLFQISELYLQRKCLNITRQNVHEKCNFLNFHVLNSINCLKIFKIINYSTTSCWWNKQDFLLDICGSFLRLLLHLVLDWIFWMRLWFMLSKLYRKQIRKRDIFSQRSLRSTGSTWRPYNNERMSQANAEDISLKTNVSSLVCGVNKTRDICHELKTPARIRTQWTVNSLILLIHLVHPKCDCSKVLIVRKILFILL